MAHCIECGGKLSPSMAKRCVRCDMCRKIKRVHMARETTERCNAFALEIIARRGAVSRAALLANCNKYTVRACVDSLTHTHKLYDVTDGEGEERIYSTLDVPYEQAVAEAERILDKS